MYTPAWVAVVGREDDKKEVDALVDGGASVSIISKELCARWGWEIYPTNDLPLHPCFGTYVQE